MDAENKNKTNFNWRYDRGSGNRNLSNNIANKPKKNFGTSMGFKPKQDIQSVLNYVRYLFYW